MTVLRKLLMLIIVLFTTSELLAEESPDFIVNNMAYKVTNLEKMEVTLLPYDYKTLSGEVYLPDTLAYNGKQFFITSIGDRCFSRSKVKAIHLPKCLKSIGKESFVFCDSLKAIILPDSLETIGVNAFASCSNLQKVVFSKRIKEISTYAFAATALDSLTLYGQNLNLGYEAFEGCNKLRYIKMEGDIPSFPMVVLSFVRV